ncbi:MAG: pilus assembly protein, partial [Actinobacteria bacterium]|nr:pilus assembly protein [Actinomycetota bacterium]
VLIGIVVLGIGVFYQQQVTNAAREAARYAVVNSATAQCPTVSWRDPVAPPLTYYRCDTPAAGWPNLVARARSAVFGIRPTDLSVGVCWSGYWTKDSNGGYSAWDASALDAVTGAPNDFRHCTIGGYNPKTDTLPCPSPATSQADDMASDLAASNGANLNQVTVYACYLWRPPAAGFLLIPSTVTLRAVVSEEMQYQQ